MPVPIPSTEKKYTLQKPVIDPSVTSFPRNRYMDVT